MASENLNTTTWKNPCLAVCVQYPAVTISEYGFDLGSYVDRTTQVGRIAEAVAGFMTIADFGK